MKIKSNQELKTLVEMLDDGDTIITNSYWDQRVEKDHDTVVPLSMYPFQVQKNYSTIRIGDKSIHVQTIES
jgi:hypothetical protein